MFEKIVEKIKKYDKIVIHRHNNPDGDAMGSQIGLKLIILANFPNKEVYAVGDYAKRYAFMDDSVMDEVDDSFYADALAIILDCGSSTLISDDRYKTAKETVRVDHHIYCEKICETEVVDTTFESCCGQITQLAVENNLVITPIAAKSLYTGMVTDSGRFRYDSVSPRTFSLAAVLTSQIADVSEIYRNLYSETFDNIELKASYILKIKFTPRNVAYIYTPENELKEMDVDANSVSRAMVGTMSDIKGVDIWVNFTEDGEKVLCELRSSKYNINPIAVKYGGGGHAKASGAALKNKDEAMKMLADLDLLTRNENEGN